MPVSYKPVAIDRLKGREIAISKLYLPIVKKLPLTNNELLSACRSPTDTMRLAGGEIGAPQNYLCSTSISIRGGSYKLAYHLSCDSGEVGPLTLNFAFVVTDELSDLHKGNPANLFLSCLDEYGLDIEIAGETRKVFERHSVALDKSFKLDSVNIGSVIKPLGAHASDRVMFYPVMLDYNNVLHMEFLYGINATKYLGDINKLFGQH